MASNAFGKIFRITTWGESHGKAIGVVIDGCPAGLELEEKDINEALALRAPGKNIYVSPRKEADEVEIFSGIFEGKTTGTPISLLIRNKNFDSSKYETSKDMLKPGHAHYTYLEKYGIFDYKGGGRASGRETACRVAAGAIAKKILRIYGVEVIAFVKQMGDVIAQINADKMNMETLSNITYESPVFCPDQEAASEMMQLVKKNMQEGDSIGGVVEFWAQGVPSGLGDPIYEKLEANLAHALLSIPATKAFEIGSGFESAKMQGSLHNDRFVFDEGKIKTETNHAGGILAGITTGMLIDGKIAFKPPSSIAKSQKTITHLGNDAIFELLPGSHHDPCIVIRAVPVVEAMVALVLVDALLLNRCARLNTETK